MPGPIKPENMGITATERQGTAERHRLVHDVYQPRMYSNRDEVNVAIRHRGIVVVAGTKVPLNRASRFRQHSFEVVNEMWVSRCQIVWEEKGKHVARVRAPGRELQELK